MSSKMQKTDRDFAAALQLYRTGHFGEAQAQCRKLLARAPRHATALHLLGTIALQTRRYSEAADCLARAMALRPKEAEIRNLLGTAYLQLERLPEAIASLEAALSLRSSYPEAQCTLGAALGKAGRIDEAIAAFRAALQSNPGMVQAHFNLAGLLAAQQRKAEAMRHYRAVLRLEPDNAIAHHELGRLLASEGLAADALPHFREAVRLEPSYAEARHNTGIALAVMRRWDEALAHMQETARIEPKSAESHYNLGTVLLLLGRLPEGFEQYEWRWQLDFLKPYVRPFRQRPWRGEDVAGRVVLLHDEQGLGDALHFCRYVPLLLRRGAEVILEVQPELIRLLELSMGDPKLRILPRARSFPGVEGLPDSDYYAPLMSLPLLFGTSLETIPAEVPYLRADPEREAWWAERLSALPGARVGLVWAGRPSNTQDYVRSITLDRLAPLGDVAGISFVSLQKGEAASQAGAPPRDMALHDFTAELRDLADTAALVSALDLVISVDSAVAHLAGALGKPVWMMNRRHGDWRWMIDREDSPWYPTLRLFHQSSAGDWDTVIARVASELRRRYVP
jgi:tetratricopeptide (TPR) repeat protein